MRFYYRLRAASHDTIKIRDKPANSWIYRRLSSDSGHCHAESPQTMASRHLKAANESIRKRLWSTPAFDRKRKIAQIDPQRACFKEVVHVGMRVTVAE